MLQRINKQRILCTKNANVCLSSHDRITLRESPESESDIILYTEKNPDKITKEFFVLIDSFISSP